MGREEQIEEREVLDSIFPDEITGELLVPSTTHALTPSDISETSYKISIALDVLNHDENAEPGMCYI